MRKFKLGKKAPRIDPRTLKMATYMDDSKLPPLPSSVDWTPKNTTLGLMLNDSLGDCTCAGIGHGIQTWTANASTIFTPPDPDVLAAYSAVSGYDPSKTDAQGNNDTDQGADELTVLNFWKNTGIDGHKILGYVQVHPTNLLHLRATIALFGLAYVGVQLPNSAMEQFENNQPWSVDGDMTIDGGHCIILTGYTPTSFKAITWGREQEIMLNWWTQCGDESYCPISQDWIEANGQSPSGFNLTQLQSDLKAISG